MSAKPVERIMWIWVKLAVDLMELEVSTSSYGTDGVEITKEDRESRKSAIDIETARLISQGMVKTKAKTTATERWDSRNPWFKAGNTRGKV